MVREERPADDELVTISKLCPGKRRHHTILCKITPTKLIIDLGSNLSAAEIRLIRHRVLGYGKNGYTSATSQTASTTNLVDSLDTQSFSSRDDVWEDTPQKRDLQRQTLTPAPTSLPET